MGRSTQGSALRSLGSSLGGAAGHRPGFGPEETPLLYRIANQLSVSAEMQPGDLEYDPGRHHPQTPLADTRIFAPAGRNSRLPADRHHHHRPPPGSRISARPADPAARRCNIAFKRGGNSLSNDLPMDFLANPRPAVFHLFGATCKDPDGFAATEDTLIEFSWALIDQEYSPKNLYDFLRRKTILLLGCDFPDWLERFFIHALTRRPESQIAVWYVSGCHQSGLHNYLRRRNARLLAQSPIDFVAELHRRWLAKAPRETLDPAPVLFAPLPTESKHGAVFISYAREDQEVARSLRAQLEAANIDTWMDESGLEPGVQFESVIRDNIKRASFFLALISRSLDLEGSDRLGRFVLKEWKWAEDINLSRNKDHHFLQPVAVDDTPAGAAFIEQPYREQLHWTRLAAGKLPPNFVEFLTKGIRRFREKAAGGIP